MVFFGIPVPDLARQIDLFWCATGEREKGRRFYEILPDGNTNIVFRFSSSGCRMTLIGPRTVKASVEIDQEAEYFCVSFRAGQAPKIADVHSAELIDSFVEVSNIGGERVDSLADRFHTIDPLSRQRVMEELLRGLVPLVRDERCRNAAGLLAASRGQVQINSLAMELGLTIRSLERLFVNHLGMTPKLHARLIRLGYLSTLLRNGGYLNLADLAYTCGYTDQSHMIKDFKMLTGRLPSERGAADMRPVEGVPSTRIVFRYR